MKTQNFIYILICVSFSMFSQATVDGIIKDEFGRPIENVAVTYNNTGVTSDQKGKYEITVDSNIEVTVTYTHISYEIVSKTFKIPRGRVRRYSPKLFFKTEELDVVDIKDRKKDAEGVVVVDVGKVKNIPGANAGVENIIMTFAGVSNSNELSTQYNVRGGNFDENLVYVNGIEVYRPFLVRSGQQEGLSFVNPSMTQNVNFSSGGFQAKYGDKLSSVLDITYRTPNKFSAAIDLSLLGGSATFEGNTLNKKLSAIVGVRYRDNSLLVNTKDTDANYDPKFTDIQAFLSYDFSKKFKLDFLGNFSNNQYNYEPNTRRTKFGGLNNPQELVVFYDGQENTEFLTAFGALKGTYFANDNLKLHLTTSAYNTQESEHYDILAAYNIGDVNTDPNSNNFGSAEYFEGVGQQHLHARNNLDAIITNIQLGGTYKINKNKIDFGLQYQREDIKDRLIEWEMIDSLGYSVRPEGVSGNQQPYEPYNTPIIPYTNIRAKNSTQISRYSAFAQWSKKSELGNHEVWYNLGLRSQSWIVEGENINSDGLQTVISPRGQFAIKPDWDKDMLFRFATGLYYQPPFYKEFRDSTGTVKPNVKAQKSIHFILGNDYSFSMWKRPFKLVTEAYYKYMTDVNPYTVNNVRIRYAAKNNAVAYAAGLDLRLNGEFVPGTESWISIGFMKTEENIDNRGYIPRPTDQRFKLGLLFQDYIPTMPDFKMYLNLVYNTGVPGGSPSYADPYEYQSRLSAYRRADIGISYIVVGPNKIKDHGWLKPFKELALGVELYNMFDINNSITNTWVRDVYTKQSYAIPNYMTSRVLNIKMNMKF